MKTNLIKRALSLLLALVLLVGNVPMAAFATEEVVEEAVAETVTETDVPTEAATEPAKESVAATEVAVETSVPTVAPTEAATEPERETIAPAEPETEPVTELKTELATEETIDPTLPTVPEETSAPTGVVPEETVVSTEAVPEETIPAGTIEGFLTKGVAVDESIIATGVVNTNLLNVRTEPSASAEIVKTVSLDTRLEFYELVTVDDTQWGRFADGWVMMKFITLEEIPGPEEDAGSCGENVEWTLDTEGVLVISGTGAMIDYASASDAPWYSDRAAIKSVVVEDGVTTIGARTFYNFTALKSVTIGSNVTTIGTYAFRGCTALEKVTIPANVTELEGSAFRACTALTEVTFGGNAPTLGDYVFNDGAVSLTVYCYEGSTGYDGIPWSDYTVVAKHVGQWIVDTDPTCTTDGSKHFFCSYCNETFTEIIPAGHDYVDGICSACQEVQILGSGSCGTDVTWELDALGTLTISGSGAMKDYSSTSSIPWYSDRTTIEAVIIETGVTGIGKSAFYGCSNFTSITIPSTVTKIGSNAFYNCSKVQNVYIADIDSWINLSVDASYGNPLSINSLTKNLYSNDTLVTDLVIPDSVTNIRTGAFYNCSHLTSLYIPDSVTTIGSSAFRGCSGLASVNIPESVTVVGSSAFHDCKGLTSVVVPDSVTSIGAGAFNGCSSLESITIPFVGGSVKSVTDYSYQYPFGYIFGTSSYDGGVKTSQSYYKSSSTTTTSDYYIPASLKSVTVTGGNILRGAFYNCDNLTSITIPESVTSINDYAFDCCSSLMAIEIPAGVTTIASNAFVGCSSLNGFWVDNENAAYCSDEFGVLFSKDLSTLIKAPCAISGVYEVPRSVTSVTASAFSDCSRLIDVVVPDSVTSIGSSAFRGCSSLESITIPFVGGRAKSATDTYQYSFGYIFGTSSYAGGESTSQYYYGSSASSTTSTTYYIPSSLKSVTVTGGNILYGAFYNCKNLTSVTISNGVGGIGDSAFYGCSSLAEITIPESVKSIGALSFVNCGKLKDIVIPDSVTSIGIRAFGGCSSLESITIPFVGGSAKSATDTYQYPVGYIFGTSSYTGGVSTTQHYYGSTTDTETSSNYYIPSTLKSVMVTGGNILYGAFYNCKNLTSITLPDGVTEIGNYSFFYCSGLTNIEIPADVTYIGDYAFQYCSGLKNVRIPDRVHTIGAYAFSRCSGITSLELPECLTAFGDYAFSRCTSLSSIEIPDSIESIGDKAFYYCSSLTNIVLPDSITGISAGMFEGCSSLPKITIPESVTSIGADAFLECGSLTDVYITNPSAWCRIAFENADANPMYNDRKLHIMDADNNEVTEVMLDASVTMIPSYAFKNSSIISIDIPDGVTSIGAYAFKDCNSLADVNIGDGVRTISSGAFKNCSSLKNIVIPDSVVNIWDGAFSGCCSLESITTPFVGLHMDTYPLGYIFGEEEYEGGIATRQCSFWGYNGDTYKTYYIPASLKTVILTGDTIWKGGFANCSNLTTIVIPASVTSFGQTTFSGCSSLQDVYYGGTQSQWTSTGSYRPSAKYIHYSCTNPENHWKTEIVDATCLDEGYTFEYCDCSYERNKTVTDAATGHSYETVTVLPTCTETGHTTYTCSACGDSYTETADALGHDMGDWVTTDATCTVDGLRRKDCSRCDYFESEVIPAIGHDYASVVTVPTCLENGYTTHTCGNCGDVYTDNTVTALGHDMSDWVITGEATCTEDGSKRKDCNRCDYFETEILAALGHAHKATVTATCLEGGYTIHTCHCGDTFEGEFVEALGHDMSDWVVTIAPTCTETGLQRKDCSRCDHYEEEVLPENGHNHEAVVTPPTCLVDGFTTHTCHCGDAYTDTPVDALGHHHIPSLVDPTYTKQGYIHHKCSRCDDFWNDTYTDPIGLPKPAVKASNNSVTGGGTLTWPDDGEADYYQIYRATSKKGKYKLLTTVETAEAEVKVSVGKTYYYKVKSVCDENPALSSGYSNVVKVTGKCAQPDVTVAVSESSGKPVLKWGKVTSAKKYTVYRATAEDGTYKKVKTTTSRSYTDSSAKVGVTYFYKVKAVASKSTYSSAYSEIKSCLTILGKPVVTAKNDAVTGKPHLSWKAISGAAQYEILRAESADGEFTKLATQSTVTYTDLSAAPDKDYWYKVNAIGESENLDNTGDAKMIHATLAKPEVNFGVNSITGEPVMTWEEVDGAVEYRIYRSSKSKTSYKCIETTTDLSYTDDSVKAGKGYYYKVIAIGENCKSSYSSYKKLTAKCAQPEISVSLSKSGYPTVSWKKVSGAKKYEVYRATSEIGTYKKVKTTTGSSFTDTKAANGKTYYYKIRAIASSKSANSTYSNALPGTACKVKLIHKLPFELYSYDRWGLYSTVKITDVSCRMTPNEDGTVDICVEYTGKITQYAGNNSPAYVDWWIYLSNGDRKIGAFLEHVGKEGTGSVYFYDVPADNYEIIFEGIND